MAAYPSVMRPSCLQYMINKLQGYSSQTYKLRPESQSSARPGDTIIVQLPLNAYVDLRSFRMNCVIHTRSQNDDALDDNYAVLPPQWSACLIDNVATEINSVTVDPGPGRMLNQMYKLISDFTVGDDAGGKLAPFHNSDWVRRGFLKDVGSVPNQGTEGPVDWHPDHTNAAILSDPTAADDGSSFPRLKENRMIVSSWLGFLQCKPEIFSTAHAGTTRIHIRLAGNEVLMTSAPVAAVDAINKARYWLEQIEFTVKTISLDDGAFSALLQARIEQGGLDISFPAYRVFTSGGRTVAGTLRLTANAQSLDYVVGYLQPEGYLSKFIDSYTGTSRYFMRTCTGAFYNDNKPFIADTSQWVINGVPYPSYPQRVTDEVYAQTLLDAGVLNDTVGGINRLLDNQRSWHYSFWAHLLRLDLECEPDGRVVSGMDLRGSTGEIMWTIQGGTGSTVYPVAWTKQTSILRVEPYRVLSVIL